MGKMFFIDLTRCTACRGCQIACKAWKNLGVEPTKNTGSHQNPPDLSATALKVVHFKEKMDNGKMQWLFFPEQCRHCVEPPCFYQANMDADGAAIMDEATGAVLYDAEKMAKTDTQGVRESCPYDIPRLDPKTKSLAKCDMCIDRVREGLVPACVKTCPTGTMHFGDEKDMEALAKKRLEEVKKEFPNAIIGDSDSVRVLYLFQEDPKSYAPKAIAELKATPQTRREMLARFAPAAGRFGA